MAEKPSVESLPGSCADERLLQRDVSQEFKAMRARLRAIDRLTKTTARAHTLEDIYDAALDAVGTALGTNTVIHPALRPRRGYPIQVLARAL
jgi:hypothetical protein